MASNWVRVLLAGSLAASLIASACTADDSQPGAEGSDVPTTLDGTIDPAIVRAADGALGATATTRPDISRLDPAPRLVDFATVGAVPIWIVGAPLEDDRIQWIVVDDLGLVTGIVDDGEDLKAFSMGKSPVDAPPTLIPTSQGTWELVGRDGLGPAAPVTVLSDGRLAAVTSDGALAVWGTGTNDDGKASAPGPFLPDAEVVEALPGVIAVLAGPTDVYSHAVVGDPFEATAVVVIDVASMTELARIESEGRVIEQRGPALVDVDVDGVLDLVLTTSSAADGARVEAYDLSGALIATGPAIGTGNRWRHVIGAVATIPGAVLEVVMPHLMHTAQLLRPDGDVLVESGAVDLAFASHVNGSRNLSMTAVLPLRTQADVVGPSPRRSALVARSVTADGFGEEVRLIEKEPTSNIATAISGSRWGTAVGFADGSIAIWVGSTL